MTAVLKKTRSFLFEEPLHVVDVWVIAVLEQMWVASALQFHKLYNGNITEIDECIYASAPDFSALRLNPRMNKFTHVLDNLETRWYEYASFYVDLNPQIYSTFSAAVISDIRPLFLNIPIRTAPQVGRLLDLYHRAFDEYIDYFIDIWNVYYMDFASIDAETGTWEYLQAFNSIAWRPNEIRVIGNPTDVYTPSPALWIELRGDLPYEDQIVILKFLTQMNMYISDGIRHHLRLALKQRVFPNLVDLFFPASLAYVNVVPMPPLYQNTVPDVTESITCPGGTHSWNLNGAWTDDLATCDDCGATKSIQSFTMEELDDIVDRWE